MVEEIEKHEGLQELAQLGWAHQMGGGSVRLATGTGESNHRQGVQCSNDSCLKCSVNKVLLNKITQHDGEIV
jgi:hypothetical protein